MVKHTNKIKSASNDKFFHSLVMIIVWIAVLVTIFPLLNVIANSLSSSDAVAKNSVYFWPKEINIESYKAVFRDSSMIYSLGFTAVLTIIYTILSLFLTVCTAYPLSKDKLFGKKALTLIIIFTMYFSGGIIPGYLLCKQLHITNTIWVLILPSVINTFNVIIMKSFIKSIPESLEESAEIDGASSFVVLFKIIVPLSKAILATLGLFYAVSRWNSFQDVLYYIQSPKLFTLQYKLQAMINASKSTDTLAEGSNMSHVATANLKSASIVFSAVPIVLVYPWLQKYFVKGVTLGSVKG
jgi:putative aldouronate transport system permease protein